jgi:3-hydroxyisobutyrate dehydrogenase
LRPYQEFREEFRAKGKPKDLFTAAMNDIDSFIDNPENFSALFEPKTPVQKPKTKSTPKPKKQDFDADFDSLKSDSSVPSSPSLSKPSQETPKPSKQRTSSVRSTEKKTEKRKSTRESEPEPPQEEEQKEEEMDIEEPQPVAKKSRKSNSNSTSASLARNESTSSSSGRRSESEVTKSLKSPRNSTIINEASGEIYGMIGLGIMGKSILQNLINNGHEVVIYNRNQSRCDDFSGSPRCTIVASPREVFEQANITFVCVSDCDAVKEVVIAGENGIIASETSALDKGLVMLSSIDCETSNDIQQAMMLKGSRYLEAQIQGSKEAAVAGELIVIASGDKTLYNDAKKCFDVFARNTYFLSEEFGQAIKMNLVLQTMAGVQLAALTEALSLADTLGLQLRDILEIISLSNLNSEFIFQKGEVVTNDKYRDPSVKLDTMTKDLKMAIEFGDTLEHPLPLVAASKELFKAAKRMEFGQDDAAAVYYAANFNKYCFDFVQTYENGNM